MNLLVAHFLSGQILDTGLALTIALLFASDWLAVTERRPSSRG